MLVDILLLVAGFVLNFISFLFGLITFVIPVEALASISQAFSYIAYVQAFFPIDTLVTVLTSYLSFLLLWYGWKLIMWVYSILPIPK